MMNQERFESIYHNGFIIYTMYNNRLNVTVYALNVEMIKENIESFKNKMPKHRYVKMTQYRNDIDKLLLIGNEILFQYGMEQLYPDMNYKEIQRAEDASGKPYLIGNDDIFFNMSHAGKYSICAFSNRPIGVDIELNQPIDLSIAEMFYCEEEYNDIINEMDSKRYKKFYEYWVLKESFTKAVGLGLAIPLNEFSFFKAKRNGLLSVEQRVNQHDYLCEQFSFQDLDYEMAICVQVA